MSRFKVEEIDVALVSTLVALAKFSACGNQSIIETYKSAYGNLWESTHLDFAISELEKSMLETLNNVLLVDIFDRTNVDLSKAYSENRFPNSEEVRDAVGNGSHIEDIVVRSYEFVRELGSGSGGTVDKVLYRNGTFERFFARKICNNIGAERDRFQREIGVLANIQHPGVVSIIDAEFSEDSAWYVMDLIEGTSLRDYEGTDEEKHHLISKILDTISYLHNKKIIHRDLKPENIMVREIDAHPIIVDFGSAYSRQKTLTVIHPGTPQYMAPEVWADPKLGRLPMSDIYACGVIAYELFNGYPPTLQDYVSIGYGSLDEIIRKTIQFRSDDRYQSIEEMREAWSAISVRSKPTFFQSAELKIEELMKDIELALALDHNSVVLKIDEQVIASLIVVHVNRRLNNNRNKPNQDVKAARLCYYARDPRTDDLEIESVELIYSDNKIRKVEGGVVTQAVSAEFPALLKTESLVKCDVITIPVSTDLEVFEGQFETIFRTKSVAKLDVSLSIQSKEPSKLKEMFSDEIPF